MRLTEMPIDSATCCENAVARMAMPWREARKNREKRTRRTATMTKEKSAPRAIGKVPRWNGVVSNDVGKARVSVPQMP